MPRKQRTAKARRDVPLTPAMKHFFMAGCMVSRFAPARLPGWVATFLDIVPDDMALAAHWLAHKDALTAEAAAAGFEPVAARWFDRDRLRADAHDVPSDINTARTAWSERFCHEFSY